MANLMSIDWWFAHDGETYQILVWLVNEDQATYELEVRRLGPRSSEMIGRKTVTTGWANAFGDRNNATLTRELTRLEQFIRATF